MPRTGLLLLGALGVAAAAPVHSDARDLRRSNDSTLLSIPQYAEDLAIRNHRLAYKGAYWDFVPYSAIVGPGAANLAMAAADGALGTAQWQSEVALVGGQIQATIQEANASIITKIHDKCLEVRVCWPLALSALFWGGGAAERHSIHTSNDHQSTHHKRRRSTRTGTASSSSAPTRRFTTPSPPSTSPPPTSSGTRTTPSPASASPVRLLF